jgi:hypothetical protein
VVRDEPDGLDLLLQPANPRELRFRDEVEAFLDPHTPEAERKVAIRPDRILAALLGYGHGSSRTATVA